MLTAGLCILLVTGSALTGLGARDRGPRGAPNAVFEDQLDNLPSDLRQAFSQGDEAFEKIFSVEEGIGPIFNDTACEGCHPGNGKGTIANNFTLYGRLDGSTYDSLPGQGGPQHQDKAIPGAPLETIPAEATHRVQRNPPPVFGMGFIEAIPEAAILARADPEDADGDGISGRPNWVVGEFEGASDRLLLGRFGRKASNATLLKQAAGAYVKDMGLTSPFFPREIVQPEGANADRVPDPELDAATVLDAAMYVRLLKPPPPGPRTVRVRQGEATFGRIGCAGCHTPVLPTGPHRIAALSNQPVHLYSDLLLHDMGPVLADGIPEGMATGSEWRTAPLWGVALAGPPFLHDGRAETLAEAILAHGGEALATRERFQALSAVDRQALLAFLDSL
jgi:CxxC motif-containing protein (DUF1111 family)